ncbi:MAG: hypothetical protein ACYTG0_00990 [Planctomycetota bacterium]|jgi:hypothetical protein
MRWIGWFFVIAIVVSGLTATAQSSQPLVTVDADTEFPMPVCHGTSRQPDDESCRRDLWRRTRYGWQWARWLVEESPVRRPSLHPAVVGLLQLFLSVFALVAIPSRAGVTAAARSKSL